MSGSSQISSLTADSRDCVQQHSERPAAFTFPKGATGLPPGQYSTWFAGQSDRIDAVGGAVGPFLFDSSPNVPSAGCHKNHAEAWRRAVRWYLSTFSEVS